MPNAETDGSVSNLDVPHRLTAKGAFQEQTSLGRNKEWVIRKHTEETEYASLDGGHTVVKETKVTVCSPLHQLVHSCFMSHAHNRHGNR